MPPPRPASAPPPSAAKTVSAPREHRPPAAGAPADPPARAAVAAGGNAKDAFLAEIRRQKLVFYQTVVAQAQKIEMTADRVTFIFSPSQRTIRDMFEQNRSFLESAAQQATGRKLAVTAALSEPSSAGADAPADAASAARAAADKKSALREQAMADTAVQTMLEVFPAEIRDVEEM
jgi:hypothetical protein